MIVLAPTHRSAENERLWQLCNLNAVESEVQSMRNLVCRRSMIGKTCLRLVGILGLPVTMTRNFCQILLYIQ